MQTEIDEFNLISSITVVAEIFLKLDVKTALVYS